MSFGSVAQVIFVQSFVTLCFLTRFIESHIYHHTESYLRVGHLPSHTASYLPHLGALTCMSSCHGRRCAQGTSFHSIICD